MSPTQALATNKLQSSFGSFSASWYFVRNGIVSLKEMRFAILCTFIGAAIGAEAVQFIDASVLTSLIPVLLIAISLYFLLAPSTRKIDGEPKLSEAMFALCIGGGGSVSMMAFLAWDWIYFYCLFCCTGSLFFGRSHC
ncbi:putative membrane protein YfcA [Vibrio sp. JCM 18905]|nr:putative membrane protein YfcA [Vibrio sp. JCM 18905]